jgi:predicted amidohydrolase YtcJ
MAQLSRRRFLAGTGLMGAGALLAGAPTVARAAGKPPKPTAAATVIKNGRVWTGTGMVAEAVAIGSDGRIMAVGANTDMTNLVDSRTVVLSAAGRTVIAGTQDAHAHPPYVIQYLIYPTLGQAQMTLSELQDALRGFLADSSTVLPGGWLNVLEWNPVACPLDALPAQASYLDAVSATIPIILRGADGHNSWVNTLALQMAGITASTPDPVGGRIVHNADGSPSGVLVDRAQDLVTTLIPEPTTAQKLPYMEMISAYMATKGITTYLDAMATEDSLELYAALTADNANLQRVQPALLVPQPLFDKPNDAVAWATGLRQQYAGLPNVKINTVKIFLDGVMEYPAQTAALLEPYLDANGKPTTNYGNLYVDNPVLARLVTAFDKAGWQVHCHAIGDRAVRTALDAYQAARRANPRGNNRHTIAHLQLVDPADYPRFAQLGVIPCFQLQWACDNYWTEEALHPFLGDERHSRLYPARSILAVGGALAGGSDWPVDPLYPWNQVATAVDRIGMGGLPEYGAGGTGLPLDPDQSITLADSLAMHTRGSAFQLRQEATTGTIEVGKVADLQILDLDATAVPMDQLMLANVTRTIVGGTTTWDATSPGFMATPAKARRVEAAAERATRDATGCACSHPS